MRRSILALVGFALAATVGLVVYWRWFPRAGTRWANEVMNPWLVREGWAGAGRSEIGTLEHFGRKTGMRHLTPVHPVPTPEGFRIVVPLAEESQWAMNVIDAGHCRLHFHDIVSELDEPMLVEPVDVRDLPRPIRWAAGRLGFKYLRLHQFAGHPGTLEPLEGSAPIEVAASVAVPTEVAAFVAEPQQTSA